MVPVVDVAGDISMVFDSILEVWLYIYSREHHLPKAQITILGGTKIRYTLHVTMARESLNSLIEEAILDAELRGVKVLSLGLLNEGEELNKNGELYIQKGNLTKVAYAIADALCERGIQVAIPYKDEYEQLQLRLTTKSKTNLILSTSYADQKTWLVGDGWNEDEQLKASKETLFIPFSHFPQGKCGKIAFSTTHQQ
ncbi:hypothetical protein SLA2020_416880 [Shorea laevis]